MTHKDVPILTEVLKATPFARPKLPTNGVAILFAEELILASAASLRAGEQIQPSDRAAIEACTRLASRHLLVRTGTGSWAPDVDRQTMLAAWRELRLHQRAIRLLVDRALRDPLRECETEVGGFLDAVAGDWPEIFEMLDDESPLRIRRWQLLLAQASALRFRDGMPAKGGAA